MAADRSFLGTGWAFPPAFSKTSRTVEMVSDVEDINQSLTILLSTSLGERVMLPEYGCNLQAYLFEPANNSLIGYLRDLVERSILFYEPRIIVQRVSITEPASFELIEGFIRINVEYLIAGTNSRFNYVYDFYLREADRGI